MVGDWLDYLDDLLAAVGPLACLVVLIAGVAGTVVYAEWLERKR